MTTMQAEERWSVATSFSWRVALVAGVIAVLVFALSLQSTQAEEPPALVLERAHALLERLMSSHDMNAAETRVELLAMRSTIRPLTSRLHRAHSNFASTLERQLDDALAQVDGDGALISSDRAEFELSCLLPIAETLSDVDYALGGRAR